MTAKHGARGGRSAAVAAVALFVPTACGVLVVLPAVAGATPPAVVLSPSGNLSDGQSISVTVGANGTFTPHAGVKILECADPGGTAANLPKDDSTCDGNTVQGSTILVAGNGSFSDAAYPVYLLPSTTLGELSNSQPICNQTHACVLYVGQNQNDFTAPKAFSAPFLITPGSDTTTSTAAPSGSNGGSGATSTTAAPTTSAATVGTGGGADPATSAISVSTGALADTGSPAEIAWVAAAGLALLLTGAIGRRRMLRGSR